MSNKTRVSVRTAATPRRPESDHFPLIVFGVMAGGGALYWALSTLGPFGCLMLLVAAAVVGLVIASAIYGPKSHPIDPRATLQPYTEHSPFGDAALAKRAQLQAALQGNKAGFRPQFED